MKRCKTIMIQGTGSGVGKSLLAAALCRIFYQDGFKVAPFKAINISLNSGVTIDGREIATSQIVQAQACGIQASRLMNPFLIKPESERLPQVIIQGKVASKKQVQQRYKNKQGLWSVVKASFDTLAKSYDTVVLEGAASPAEPSFIQDDVVNLRIAKYTNSPVVLVGDIDKGGVFASLEGTVAILRRHDPEAARLIKGVIINKYQGETRYLSSACQEFTEVTGIPVLGIIPFIKSHGIAEEDTWFLESKSSIKEKALLDIAVIQVPSLQNSTDFEPLINEPTIQVRFVSQVGEFGQPDLVIIPGSKNTIFDLQWLKSSGLAKQVIKHSQAQKAVIGICGGFQMLGEEVLDPLGIESRQKATAGLGLFPAETTFQDHKLTTQTKIKVKEGSGLLKGAGGIELSGYEIHMGRTKLKGKIVTGLVSSKDGWILGTYLHDLFASSSFRRLLLQNLAKKKGKVISFPPVPQQNNYDVLAGVVRDNLDMKVLYQILKEG